MDFERDNEPQLVLSKKPSVMIPLPLEEIEEIPELLPKEDTMEEYMGLKAKKTPQSCTSTFRKSGHKRFDSSEYFLEKEASDYCHSHSPVKEGVVLLKHAKSYDCNTPDSIRTSHTTASLADQ